MHSRFKMSTTCNMNNQDTAIPTALALFSIVIMSILSVFLLKLLLNTNINRKQFLFILNTRRKIIKILFWGFVTDDWFQSVLFYLICDIDDKRYRFKNVENSTLPFLFSNYFFYQEKQFEVLFSVYLCI